MTNHVRKTAIGLFALLLASCGPGESEPGPGGVTVGDAEELDEAAAQLDARHAEPEKPNAAAK